MSHATLPVEHETNVNDNRPYYGKKRAAFPKRKKGIFFHFQGAYFFHALLMLMYEMPKIGPR